MKNAALAVFAALLPAAASAQISFGSFHTPAQINAELNNLPVRFPGLAHVTTIGNSLGGQPIRAVRISDNAGTDEIAEGDVVFLALHHAREWISTETALYLAERLLMEYAGNPQVQADLNRVQVWVIPAVNPDGYDHTLLPPPNPMDPIDTWPRYWRKNRRLNADGTRGVDLNRNWGYEWGLNSGSSPSPWSDTYRGTAPFSEPETQVMRNFLNSRPNLKAFVSYHSYSELFLRPWSYTTIDPPGESTLGSIAQRSIARIAAVHSHTYTDVIGYTSSGEATDWLWGEKRVAAFTPELGTRVCPNPSC